MMACPGRGWRDSKRCHHPAWPLRREREEGRHFGYFGHFSQFGFHAEGISEGIVVFFWLKRGKARRACHRRASMDSALLALYDSVQLQT